VNVSPALAVQPKVVNAAALAPSSVPRFAGTKNVANRTPDPSASRTVAAISEADNPRLCSTRSASTTPINQPTKWNPVDRRNDRQCRR
jgi:hypothetical protein